MSFVHLIVLCFGCLVRIIITFSGFDLTHSSLFFCKFRIYFLTLGIFLSRYYLCLISIDRWMIISLNAQIRLLSNPHRTQQIILITTPLWIIFYINTPIGFRQESNGCVASSDGFYSTFYLISNICLTIIPIIIVMVFVTLILYRIIYKRAIDRRQQIVRPIEIVERNIINHRFAQLSNKNRQLIRINLIQVLSFIIFNCPNTIYTMYSYITQTYKKSIDRIAIDSFFVYLASYLLYTHCAVS
ncbi:unnamed protein product [Adineta ricciae]|uniref:G-protein coupled receptors family 1 profile domain-containing protein n=1 Tax=Adineta ricciae TaxID=249248 RepID=A0A815NNG1_ADIRI|nr:unnamed protein product [Adineta ricciae]CAF1435692.1 unnamed protein product [Adineta ricciae]